MGISGQLRTMTLPDLLQWVGSCRKTGLLELERGGTLRRIAFYDGAIVACATDDPRLASPIAARAEEVLYSLFEWSDAEFRFEDGAGPAPGWLPIECSVDEILLNGVQRLDEIKMIRAAFPGSGTVLAPTGAPAPPQLANSAMARRIVAQLDGRCTIAEVLGAAETSEFLVLKLLYHLLHRRVVAIAEVRPPALGSTSLLDEIVASEPAIAEVR